MAQGFGAEQEMGMWREKDEESEEERGSTTKFEMVNGDSDGETLIDIDQDIEFEVEEDDRDSGSSGNREQDYGSGEEIIIDEEDLPPNLERQLQSWSQSNTRLMGFYLPLTVILALSLYLSRIEDCSKNLRHWATVQLVIFVVLVITLTQFQVYYFVSQRTNAAAEWKGRLIGAYACNRLSLFATLWWCVYGASGLSNGKLYSCDDEASLYVVSFTIITIHCFVFGVIAFFCCSSISCLCFLLYCSYRMQMQNAPVGVTQDVINSHCKEERFTSDLIPDKDSAKCAICLEQYVFDEKLRYLPCKHHYHLDCVDRWLLTNKTCPVCKQDVDDQENQPTWGENGSEGQEGIDERRVSGDEEHEDQGVEVVTVEEGEERTEGNAPGPLLIEID